MLAEIAHSRAEIDQARLLVLSAARRIDISSPKNAMQDIGMAKVTYFKLSVKGYGHVQLMLYNSFALTVHRTYYGPESH